MAAILRSHERAQLKPAGVSAQQRNGSSNHTNSYRPRKWQTAVPTLLHAHLQHSLTKHLVVDSFTSGCPFDDRLTYVQNVNRLEEIISQDRLAELRNAAEKLDRTNPELRRLTLALKDGRSAELHHIVNADDVVEAPEPGAAEVRRDRAVGVVRGVGAAAGAGAAVDEERTQLLARAAQPERRRRRAQRDSIETTSSAEMDVDREIVSLLRSMQQSRQPSQQQEPQQPTLQQVRQTMVENMRLENERLQMLRLLEQNNASVPPAYRVSFLTHGDDATAPTGDNATAPSPSPVTPGLLDFPHMARLLTPVPTPSNVPTPGNADAANAVYLPRV